MSITRDEARGRPAFILCRRWLPLACGAFLFLAGCAEVSVEPVLEGGSSSPTAVASVTREAPPPSIVLILTDDQRWDTLAEMPTVGRELVGHGISFERGYVSNPLCCPSRASILTGRYSHSNGVYTNKNGQPYGGFRAFDDRSTVATWLDEAGYRTAMLGKYFNGYEGSYVPPGWDRWFATYRDGAFYDYLATDDGVVRAYGSDPGDYGTDVLAGEALRFIESTPQGTPLFMYFAPHAPHEPAMAAPGDARAYRDLRPWRPASYNETDVSDKPAYIRDQPRMDTLNGAQVDEFRRSQLGSLMAVDRAVGTILDTLAQTGRLENTLIVFTSDNGMLWGEHRWATKLVPYEESIHMPFVVRFDAMISSPRIDERLVLNVDLAPTFADLADVSTRGADGRSLVPLFGDEAGPWRTDFLLEHMQHSTGGVPTYCGVHSERYVYVRYRTGEEELYDLERDPAQLVNLINRGSYEQIRHELRQRLQRLCDPPPPGYHS
jgi:N-acetylglucosamine-6-sulfatase